MSFDRFFGKKKRSLAKFVGKTKRFLAEFVGKKKRSVTKRKDRFVRSFFKVMGREPVSPLRRKVLRLVGRETLMPCEASAVALRSFDVAQASVSTVAIPRMVGTAPTVMRGTYPKPQAHLFKGASVAIYSSAVVLPEHVVMSHEVRAARNRILAETDGLFELKPGYCFKFKADYPSIPKGIFISGAGASNWYHFMIEILPKALLAQNLPPEFADYPLLVPQECSDLPSFAQALAIFAGGRQIIPLAQKQPMHVESLISFDEVSLCPYNLVEGEWTVPADFGQHDDLFLRYFKALRDSVLGAGDTSAPMAQQRRIFLTRPMVRRNYNQDALVAIALRYGFEVCEPGNLTLDEQANLFASAGVVIGASGAAWVGMMFRAAPARFLSWLPKEYDQFCCYSSLAAMMGHQMEFLEYTPDFPLNSTADAYGTGYYLDPDQFERALQRMIGDA
jgi:capsular polysaccharide biosynthesis protein